MKKNFFGSCIIFLICMLTVGCSNGNENRNIDKSIEFNTKNLDGEKVDTIILKKHNLTMINIWGTYCGPCKEEMPMLQEIYEEMKEKNVNLVGLVSDADSEENISIAKEILSVSGAKFENIIPDEKLIEGILKDIQGVPTTIFVDSNGKVIGSEILGAVSKDDYITAIESRLKKIKESEDNKQ